MTLSEQEENYILQIRHSGLRVFISSILGISATVDINKDLETWFKEIQILYLDYVGNINIDQMLKEVQRDMVLLSIQKSLMSLENIECTNKEVVETLFKLYLLQQI